MRLVDLGPLHVSEPWFSRRIRVHQAWYRTAVLGLRNHGTTRPPRERPLGSILAPEDARRGANFLSTASHQLFERRRIEGWGVDPVRTLAYLTSSQAMTLNLIGPLAGNQAWLSAVLSTMFSRSDALTSVESVSVEYFSRHPSQALGDRTTIDVLIRGRSGSVPVFVAIETKLGDRFNSRHVVVGDAYSEVKHLWVSPDVPRVQATSQLGRVHALAEHVARRENTSAARTMLLLVHHDDDPRAPALADGYRDVVAEPATFRSATLSEFLLAMRAAAPSALDAFTVDSLKLRYADLAPSESVWQQFLEAFHARRRGS